MLSALSTHVVAERQIDEIVARLKASLIFQFQSSLGSFEAADSGV